MQHNFFMRQALELAQKGQWYTAPNPCVGAVLVWQEKIIATGYHKKYGEAHAEANCLYNAIKKGVFNFRHPHYEFDFTNPFLAKAYEEYKDVECQYQGLELKDCSLYVTLEPCNHHGKTPPCTQAIIDAKIGSVYIGAVDPNPKASGGIEKLREQGVHVETGILKEECHEVLADFLTWHLKKRPYTILKMACSLDGRIGPKEGHNHRISGVESHHKLMELRENIARSGGAVLVGGHTFQCDNPKLTVRDEEGKELAKQPLAVIMSSKIPCFDTSTSNCLTNRPKETVLFCTYENAKSKEADDLRNYGVNIFGVEKKEANLNVKEALGILYKEKKCPYVLCEGGSTLGLSLLDNGLVDELILYIAPIIFGDEEAKPVFKGKNVFDMCNVLRLNLKEVFKVGEDCHIHLKMEQACSQD